MHDLFLISIPTVIYMAFMLWMHLENKKELQRVYKEWHEERQSLLDRIMANNIHEYKSVTGSPVKRSPSGNFLKDRMVETAKLYTDLE